jgi:tyrosinase
MSNGPSGQFGNSHSRYEDFIALHQTLTPNVHMNAKFVYWHRQFLWTFEQVLRDECGFDRELPWFDETRYSGRFAQSSLLSSQWFGTANEGGNCVDNGVSISILLFFLSTTNLLQQFANLALNIGPGTDNTYHCLSRNLDEGASANTNQQVVDGCNAQSDFAQMASCSELSAHAWGHNCIGGVMEDVASSVGDPLFWMHHGFIDRNFRIWQNADPNRLTYVDGVDHVGNPLTLDTTVNVYDIRPTVTIRDLIDTKGTHLCYKYQY